jgi:hypothetical protein
MVQESMTTLSFWLINVVPDLLRRLFLFDLKGVDDDDYIVTLNVYW